VVSNAYIQPGLDTGTHLSVQLAQLMVFASGTEVIMTVARLWGTHALDILSRSRRPPIAEARQVVMFLLVHSQKMHVNQVARMLSRDRTTVIYSLGVVKNYFETEKRFRRKFIEMV
jgi:chromosomal replication initiation ATPase DnaA